MAKYFFNIGAEQPDRIGVDLPNHAAVRSEAVRAAGEILRDIDGEFSGKEWVMDVRDDQGHLVMELRFTLREAVQDEPK